MYTYIVRGGNKLNGSVRLKAAKNSVLALIAASILTEDDVILKNCPDLTDIANKLKIVNSIGAKALCGGDDIFINARNARNTGMSAELARTLRSSFVLLGPILSRFKEAKIYLPGGCRIGQRPVDIHLDALEKLNVKITNHETYLLCDAREMRGSGVTFKFPSVGATQNVMMAAVLAHGTTTIQNAAKEPEVVDLQNFLNAMGASVAGAGTGTIEINGVEKLHGAVYTPISDRIVAGTLVLAAAACGGDLTINNACPHHLNALFEILKDNYCEIEYSGDTIRVRSDGRLNALGEIASEPYPFFPTDLQPQLTALAAVCLGNTGITEKIFENRFGHIAELKKMGAKIYVDERARTALVQGVDALYGAEVSACDLRCGASLVIAAMRAKGISVIHGVEYIDRGYENFEMMLRGLGADIVRVQECKRKPLQKIFDK
ncbi:MAG: UDP-N-acetylglucosamine 1-carboxyvinyltransferase [Clostridiales bacterium]|jgi:UDP-N-acetylglucosamine 1-carboxyvinyltransferase|nr:UDP-N-acetylglucosamine 1-carboxyvinyltransferase [Clostridiales bacterium]